MDISSGRTITIRIAEEPTTDGRRYLRSPDLKGFHFILDQEDSRDAILPTLKAFIQSKYGLVKMEHRFRSHTS